MVRRRRATQRVACNRCSVRHTGILCDLPDDALRKFLDLATTVLYRPHQLIFREGSPCLGVYILCDGAVKLSRAGRRGEEHTVHVSWPGELLGEVSFEPKSVLALTAEALIHSQVSFLPWSGFTELIRKQPLVAVRTISQLSQALRASRMAVHDLAFKSGEARLATLILQLSDRTADPAQASKVVLPLSRRELGEAVGVATETVIRLLGKLKSKRVISTGRGGITILDRGRLERLAAG